VEWPQCFKGHTGKTYHVNTHVGNTSVKLHCLVTAVLLLSISIVAIYCPAFWCVSGYGDLEGH